MPHAAMHIAPTINAETALRMQRIAEAKHRSIDSLVDEAVHQYIEREERRAATLSNVTAAWDDFQETGLHLTGDEVANWLDTWGTDDEKAAPACHR